MRIVVDASVAVKWFVLEANSEQARRLLDSDATLIAPDLIIAEVANVMWKRQRLGDVRPEQATEVAAALPMICAEFLPSAHLVARAAAIARVLNYPVYDCFYLAAAEDLATELVTDDVRLARRLAGTEWASRIVTLTAWGAR